MTVANPALDELLDCYNAFMLYEPVTGKQVGCFVHRGSLLDSSSPELPPWTDRSRQRDVSAWVNNDICAWHRIGQAGYRALSVYRNFRFRWEQGQCQDPSLSAPNDWWLRLRVIVLVEPQFQAAAEAGRDVARRETEAAKIIPHHVAVVTNDEIGSVTAAIHETMPRLPDVPAGAIAEKLLALRAGMSPG